MDALPPIAEPRERTQRLESPMPAIVVEGLERGFGDVRAVQGVDLEVAEGEIYGFLGPNGAGKTTTVRMLTTLLLPTGGRASVAGHDIVGEAAEVRRSIGVALQEAALDPLMTGRELIRLQATLHGIPTAEGEAPRATRCSSGSASATPPTAASATYSGGMQRRLDLAAALVHEPRVLFLDEPTTGLDPVSRKTIWEEVATLNGEGTTVFLTTQYLEEADQLADRVGIIDSGRIVAEGPPRALKAEVGNPHIGAAARGGLDRRRPSEIMRRGRQAAARQGRQGPGRGSRRGAPRSPRVVRALDEAGIAVESLELVEPTLDDVFVAKTGHHLEAEGDGSRRGGAELEQLIANLRVVRALGMRSVTPDLPPAAADGADHRSSRRCCSPCRRAAPAPRSTCPASPRCRASSSSCWPGR